MRSTPPVRRIAAVAAGLLVVAAAWLVGCDTGDGRTLADPAPGATAPPLLTTTTAPPPSQVPPSLGTTPDTGGLVLGSAAIAPGGEIPARHTCDGEGVSPPLAWVGLPEDTVEVAISVVDIDVVAGRSVHWVVAGLDPALGGLAEGEVPESAVEARNHTSEFGWTGPCPPPGETHAYVFTLYALSQPSGVPAGAEGTDAIDVIASTPGAASILTATYKAA